MHLAERTKKILMLNPGGAYSYHETSKRHPAIWQYRIHNQNYWINETHEVMSFLASWQLKKYPSFMETEDPSYLSLSWDRTIWCSPFHPISL